MRREEPGLVIPGDVENTISVEAAAKMCGCTPPRVYEVVRRETAGPRLRPGSTKGPIMLKVTDVKAWNEARGGSVKGGA